MKVIIAGSRTITQLDLINQAVAESGFDITEVVSGTANGVDSLGEVWALGAEVPVQRFPAQWQKYGKSAGFKRNRQMADYADAAVVIWDGKSRGTLNMIEWMLELSKPVYVKVVE